MIKINKIENRITVYFSLLIMVVILMIVGINTCLFYKRFAIQKEEILEQQAKIITQNISQKIDQVRNLTYLIQKNKQLCEVIQEGKEGDEYLNQTIYKLYQDTYGIQNITILNDQFKLLTNQYSEELIREVILENKYFKEFVQSKLQSYFSMPNNFPGKVDYEDYNLNPNLTFYARIMDTEKWKTIGYAIIQLKREYLFNDEMERCKQGFDAVYFVDQDFEIIHSIGKINEEIVEKNYTIIKERIASYPKWQMVGVISQKRFLEDLILLNMYIILIGEVGIFVSILMGMYLSKKITLPILKLEEAFRKVEQGEMMECLEIEAKDELKYLVQGFNSMLASMKIFIDTIYQEQEEKEEAEIEALKFELESLQHQINPHFIYNTLNTIAYVADKKEDEETKQLVQAFNDLLRASLSNQKELVTLVEEISLIQKFLAIQSYRYGEIFKTNIIMDEDIEGCKIPKLILQPLVENALFHGIAPCQGGGEIMIKAQKIGERLHIEVIDNGVGMGEEHLKNLRYSKGKGGCGFNRVGIFNIQQRLSLYYGKETRFEIQSKEGKGTAISFIIPYDKK